MKIDDNKEECINLHREGWSFKSLATKYECGATTVGRRLISWKVDTVGNPRKKVSTLTQKILKETVEYNEETGIFKAKITRGIAYKGKILGSKTNGYLEIVLFGKKYKAHRLAWLYVFGEWPKEQIDHIDHIRDHNWIKNLREVSHSENGKNQQLRTNNTSGVTGITNRKGKFYSRITVDGVEKHLGVCDTIEEAEQSRINAKKKFGFHKNHGK